MWISPSDPLLRQRRHLKTTARAQRSYARRTEVIEPIFGIGIF